MKVYGEVEFRLITVNKITIKEQMCDSACRISTSIHPDVDVFSQVLCLAAEETVW